MPVRACRPARGFALVELLVVLAILGMLLGIATLAARPDEQARLRRDAERLSALFTLAAEEAELRARPLAWQGDTQGYVFFQAGRDGWQPLATDDEFRARRWEAGAVRLTLQPSSLPTVRRGPLPEGWIEFARDGVQPPFVLRLALVEPGSAAVTGWTVRGDGRGNYIAEVTP